MQKIEPLADQIVIRPTQAKGESAGGILLPESALEKKSEGTIVSVGPGRIAPNTGALIVPAVSEGDHVVYSKFAGTAIQIGGEELLVIKENDILVRLVEAEEPVAVG